MVLCAIERNDREVITECPELSPPLMCLKYAFAEEGSGSGRASASNEETVPPVTVMLLKQLDVKSYGDVWSEY